MSEEPLYGPRSDVRALKNIGANGGSKTSEPMENETRLIQYSRSFCLVNFKTQMFESNMFEYTISHAPSSQEILRASSQARAYFVISRGAGRHMDTTPRSLTPTLEATQGQILSQSPTDATSER